MQCNNVTTIPKGLLQLRDSLSSMMDSLYCDPKVAALMNTSMGQYLNGHPFLALAVLVFGAMATVPIGIFLTFATVTFIGATVGFVLLEGKSLHYLYNTYCPLLQCQYTLPSCVV
uniref:Uncharacterized protein n=1 Tax=Oncorhynchus kisutch TaxID=8019 RepID=A0A8C7JVV8_ONCKI